MAPAAVTLDDGDAGYSDSRWISTASYGYGGDARIGHANYSGEAAWQFYSLDSGTYRVLGTWHEHSNRATDVELAVYSGNSLLHQGNLNQRRSPADRTEDGLNWEQLAIVNVTQGELRVIMRPGTDGLTIADAVRVEAIQPNTSVLATLQSGAWSSPATWGGRVPSANDDVLIRHEVYVDVGSARQVEIDEAGELVLAGRLDAHGSLIVFGAMTGVEGSLYFHVEDDRRFVGNVAAGTDPRLPDFHAGDIGLWGMPGARINLHGEYVTPWLDAVSLEPPSPLAYGVAIAPAIRAGTAMLEEAPQGWRPGDALLLVNEKGKHQLASLVEVIGTSIHYRPLDPSSDSEFVANVLSVNDQSVHPKVANLSRRLQIVSADVVEGDTRHRAHTLFFGGSTANLTNVELRNLGPRGKLGRYPVHFHHGGASSSSLAGSSIWQDVSEPGNRFVALHGVQGVRVVDNVGFASRGHGYFMEDGYEYGNEIVSNLSVAVAGPEELSHLDSDIGGSHHFWLRTGNIISGNVAAGDGAIGLVILPSKAPDQSTAVSDQEALGSKRYGIWSFAPNVVVDGSKVAYAEQAGIAIDAKWGRDSSGARINNPLLILNGLNSPSYESQLYLNGARDVRLIGGVLAGNKGIHTHYSSTLKIDHTRIDVGTFMTPTYWESEVILTDVELNAEKGFDRGYSIRHYAPGLVQINNSEFSIGSLHSEGGVLSVNFTSPSYRHFPGFFGTAVENAWRLDQRPLPSGFVLLPETTRTWKVAPIGQDLTAQRSLYKPSTFVAWSASPTGYPYGLPPGEYQIEAFNAAGESLGRWVVQLKSGMASVLTA